MAKKEKESKSKSGKAPSAQAHLPIAEIKENAVVLRDGTLRAVLLVSSINFALKSDDEQTAIVSAYVGFLNSLEFPIQIVMQSRRLQIQPYLDNLAKREREMTNELLRVQIADYRSFVKELVDIGQIMTKRFYVVVPYNPLTNKNTGFWTRFKDVLRPSGSVRLKEKNFQERKKDLDGRVHHVTGGLESIGLTVAPLDTQALIELYYSTYNPDISFSEQLQDLADIQVERPA
jgi:hypothetical protein